MISVFSFVVGLFVTIILIPPLIRSSVRFDLLDSPDPRKVHSGSIPRVGGIAIAVGVVLPILAWVPLDRMMTTYLIGATVIVFFGVWDDRRALDYRWKFAAQLIAVGIVVFGGVRLDHLPFFGVGSAPAYVTYPISVLFLLGITNAINLFDGLDGLAGGCVLLSLAAISLLELQGGAEGVILPIALAAMGGILGFLRYNTHPAVVFMGDAGSQFLGFTTAVLAILLIEQGNTALNPGLPLLLLGLPVLDTLSVMLLRLSKGISPFTPDRTHLHHKLLNLGFYHYEAVSLIYLVQAVLVAAALFLTYANDITVIGVFAGICGVVMLSIFIARRAGWQRRGPAARNRDGTAERRNLWLRRMHWLPRVSAALVAYGLAGFMIAGAVAAPMPTADIGRISLGLAAALAFAIFFLKPWVGFFTRLGVYLSILFVIFALNPLFLEAPTFKWAVNLYLLALALVLIAAIRVTRRDLFQVTPQDLLIAVIALAVPTLPGDLFLGYPIGSNVLRVVILFYAGEFLISRSVNHGHLLRGAALATLLTVGLRSFFA